VVLRPPDTTEELPRAGAPDGAPGASAPSPGGKHGAHQVEGWRGRHRARTTDRRARRRERRSARRFWFGRHPWPTGLLAAVVLLTPVWVSLGSTLTDSALGPTVGARFVEWVRDHGGNGLVRWIENEWYTHHQPPKGGQPPKGAIPPPPAQAYGRRPTQHVVPHLPAPASIAPFTNPPVAGEGQWHPAGRLVGGMPAVYEAFLRPDAVHTSLVVGVAWMDTSLLRATQYSGTYVPGDGPWHYTAPVARDDAATLVAAFNSGFRMKDAQGGYYAEGKMVTPLRNGAASFVIYDNGTASVGQWGRDFTSTAGMGSVRQNLDLLVDNGQPVPGLYPNDTTRWGFTLGNAVYVWRSGVGVTANGALVYAGGPGLNITTLADVLARAGAVRAMELDINTAWVNLTTYAPATPDVYAAPANGTPLLPAMSGGATRWFSAWDRDFITMSSRYSG